MTMSAEWDAYRATVKNPETLFVGFRTLYGCELTLCCAAQPLLVMLGPTEPVWWFRGTLEEARAAWHVWNGWEPYHPVEEDA